MNNPQISSDDSSTCNTDSSSRKQIRGSTVLLAGRGCSLLLNLLTQVVIIRALSKTSYGELAYVISIVELLSIAAVLCMDKTFSRYGAIYHEQNDQGRFAGSLILAICAPISLGIVLIALVWILALFFPGSIPLDATTWPLMLLVVFLTPGNGIASVSLSLLTILKGARAVFFRKHFVGPLLKLILVGAVCLWQAGPIEIAWAMVISGGVILLIDLWLVGKMVAEEGLLSNRVKRELKFPVRELIRYGFPTLISDVAFQMRGVILVVLLGWLATADSAASYRASLSLVRVNELVILNFMVMFVPLASRLFSAGETKKLLEMHRSTSLWIMTLSFPVFAASVALSRPGIQLLYGDAYLDVTLLIVILSAAYFVQASYGFNGLLLRVLGHMNAILIIELTTAAVTLILACFMISHWGAVGAAGAAAVGVCFQCSLKALAVRRHVHEMNGFGSFVPKFITTCIALCVLCLSYLFNLGWVTGTMVVLLSSWIVLCVNRKHLQFDRNFPELKKVRILNRLLGIDAEKKPEPHQSSYRLAYMMSRFPKLTETFVLREMIEMEKLGIDVSVYPLQREKTKFVHPEAKKYVDRAIFTPWLSISILFSCLKAFCTKPFLLFSTFFALIKENRKSRRFLMGAILFFPKSIYLAQRMEREKIDHLHAHFASHPAMVAWVIHRLSGIPFSFTAHGSDLHRDQSMLQKKVEAAAATITISDYNRKLIINHCGEQFAERIHVIHCGIDPDIFTPQLEPTDYEQGLGPFQMICIGTLHEVKGQFQLIEACKRLHDDAFEFTCHLIGDGPDRKSLEEFVRQLGLQNRVVFHGRKTSHEIQQLLKQIDVIIAPSVPTADGRREGIPVVLMEGMASHIPAIASDLSGIPELVKHNQTGLLVPPHDTTGLAEAILTLASDHTLRNRLTAQGYQFVREEFDVAINSGKLLHVILPDHKLANEFIEQSTEEDTHQPSRYQSQEMPV
ncbi:glycosyltransferase [Rubinisphaera italica]|uniref:Putative teichuronic acid biosynthesis glycosyltransferase TuaC n=1 Tax=Rubinisphaera italica TaxID=2527969 RepID=A0A5C5XET2_9PLAN|nr:glycosyltransferase [Rubinisphaera italica]TWT61557.1 putative teichuronic acid biosynthesis glycosyltransferase TuaC [Rubinisphaera italica]